MPSLTSWGSGKPKRIIPLDDMKAAGGDRLWEELVTEQRSVVEVVRCAWIRTVRLK